MNFLRLAIRVSSSVVAIVDIAANSRAFSSDSAICCVTSFRNSICTGRTIAAGDASTGPRRP
jgi:hypothetical protein